MTADCDPLVACRVAFSFAEATDTSFILSPSLLFIVNVDWPVPETDPIAIVLWRSPLTQHMCQSMTAPILRSRFSESEIPLAAFCQAFSGYVASFRGNGKLSLSNSLSHNSSEAQAHVHVSRKVCRDDALGHGKLLMLRNFPEKPRCLRNGIRFAFRGCLHLGEWQEKHSTTRSWIRENSAGYEFSYGSFQSASLYYHSKQRTISTPQTLWQSLR